MAQLLTGTRIYGTGTVDTQLFVSGTNSATSTTTGALQVVGGVGVGGNLYVGGTIYGASLNGTASTATNADNIKTVLQVSSATYYPTFVDANNSTAAYEALYTTSSLVINPGTGKIGIGNSTPNARLHIGAETEVNITNQSLFVQGSKTGYAGFKGLPLGQLFIYDDTASTAGSGGAIGFGANTGASQRTWIASINSERDSATNDATNYGGSLVFYTRPAQATPEERVRITSTGSVGIGTSTPLSKFVVNGGIVNTTTYTTSEARIADGTLHLMKTSAGGVFEALRAINNDTTVGTTVRLLAAATSDPFNNANGGKVFIDAVRTASNMDLVFSLNDTSGAAAVERLRILGSGAIAFNGSTSYGVSGQILQSNGNAAPTWISTGSLTAANATTATHLAGGVAGQIPYQTAPGVTSFLSTGTAGDVLVSNGSSAATYNNTLRLAGSTNATSTTSGALQVVGGVGVGGDLFIQGDIRTNDTLFNLINGNATTVNFAGDATTLTMGASGSGTTNVRNNLTVSGNLTVQGTTTIVDSTVTNIADPIITLGGGAGNTAPVADDNKDRGIAFKWVNNGGTTSTGFFGYDDSTGYLTYIQTATITNEVVSGTKGAVDANLAGGSAMALVYQSAADTTAFLAAGTSGYILQTNGTGSVPSWVSASGVSAGSATNADNIRTISQASNASYYPTFVDSNNAANAYESVYTTSSFVINPQSGNIGIGTTSPQRRLSIANGGPVVEIDPAGIGSVNPIYFNYNRSTSVYTTPQYWALAHNWMVNGGTQAMALDANGNLMVGTTTIGTGNRMNVVGNNVVFSPNTAGKDTHTFSTGASDVGTYAIKSDTTTKIYLNADGNSYFTGGNVGIGNSSPGYKLDVSSGVSATPITNGIVRIVGTGTNPATGSGGGLLFAQQGSNGSYANYASIYGVRTNNAANNAVDTVIATGSPLDSIALSERLRITTAGGIAFGGAANYGSSGQVLQSNGDAAPTWINQSSIAAGSAPLTNTYVGFGSASNLLTGSSSLTWNGTKLYVNGNINAVQGQTASFNASAIDVLGSPNQGTYAGYLLLAKAYISGLQETSMVEGEFVLKRGGTGSGNRTDRYRVSSCSGYDSEGFVVQITSGSGLGAGFFVSTVKVTYSGIVYHAIKTTVTGGKPDNGVMFYGSSANAGMLYVDATYISAESSFGSYTFVDSAGKFGIGTQPSSPLHIVHTNLSAEPYSGIIVKNSSTSGSAYTGVSADGYYQSHYRYSLNGALKWQTRVGNGNGTDMFSVYSWTAGADLLTILPNGNVGIGTTNTTEKLHIFGTASSGSTQGPRINLQYSGTSGAAESLLQFLDFRGVVNASMGSNLQDDGVGTAAAEMVFKTATAGTLTERLRINRNGAIAFNGASSYGSSGQVLQSNGNAPPTWINQSSIAAGSAPLTSTYVGFGSGSNLLTGSANLTYASSILNLNYQAAFNATTPGYTNYGLHFNGQSTADYATGITFSAGGASAANANAGIYSQGSGSYGTKMYFATTDSYATGSKTRMMIDQAGNVGIGTVTPINKLEVKGVFGAPATTGSAQNGIARFSQTSGGGSLDIGFGDPYSWIQSRQSADYSTNYSLALNPNGGNVGIGTTAPESKLHVEVGNATAYTPANTLVSGQTARISNTDATSGVSANLLFVAKGAGGGNGLGSISGVNTGVGSLAFTFGTRHSSSNVTERMRITSDGNVGIGTSNPINKFEVAGTAGQLFSVSDSFTGTIFSANDVSGIPSIEVLDTGLVKFAQYGGQVAINTGTVASSTASLSVYGMIYTMGTLGEIRASSEITAYYSSDRRLKENIKLIENPITILDQIRGVTFDWTDEHIARRGGEDGYFVRKHDIGVIAQEVQAVLPELVGTREDGYLAVKYEKMVPLLIEAIKSQQKTIDTLTSEIKEIKEFLSSLKNN